MFFHINLLSKILIIFGVVLILTGIFLFFFQKISFFGKLPGDIKIEKENFKFYFPITSSIIVSILLSIILTLIFKFLIKNK